MRASYIVLLVVGWILMGCVIYLPGTDGDLLQSLWVKSWWWIPVLLICSGRMRQNAWRRTDRAGRILLIVAVALVVANILVDYVLIVRVLKFTAPQISGGLKFLATCAYIGSLLAGVAAGAAVIRKGANDLVR